jgi:hypothetical protein
VVGGGGTLAQPPTKRDVRRPAAKGKRVVRRVRCIRFI